MEQYYFENEDSGSYKKWILIVTLALFVHLLFIFLKPWFQTPSRDRIEVNTIDPSKLAQIKKQWKNKELLLSKKRKNEITTPPVDPKYESDKNIRVKKEQRAQKTDILPKKANQPAQKSNVKSLSQLGVPFKLTSSQPKTNNQDIQQEEADQNINDRTLPTGGENLLNAQESVYYSYYSRMYESVGPIWQSMIRSITYRKRIPPGDYLTTVDVIFNSDGDLVDIRYLNRSGIQDFDNAVQTAWNQTGRFSNPPKALIGADGYVHTGWTFTVHVSTDYNVNYLPPERNY